MTAWRMTPTRPLPAIRSARWRRRLSNDFAGHAKATDRVVGKRVVKLVAALTKTRAATERDVVDALPVEKASSDVKTLTKKQQAAVQAAIDAMDAAAYVTAIYDETEVLVEVGWNAARALLDVDSGFDVVPTWALDKIKDAAKQISDDLVERDQTTLRAVLERAFLEGSSSSDVADALKNAFANGITIYDEDGAIASVQKSEAWFSTVARTEMQRAAVQGQVALYTAAGIKTVRWQSAEPCDYCAEADDVVLPLGDQFPGVDVDAPPAHPNCRCVLIPADADLGDFGGTDEDRANARRGNKTENDE